MKSSTRVRSHSCARLSQQTKALAFIFLFLFCCELPKAHSAIVSTSGSVVQIAPPTSVNLGALESDTSAELFAERSSVLLANSLNADVSHPGAVNSQVTLSPSPIAAGQRVDSYLIHADPVGPGSTTSFTYEGSVTFDTPILGLMWSDGTLDASDPILGSPATVYGPDTMYRGYEGPGLTSPRDSLVLSQDRLTLNFALRTTEYYDELRIVTASIPEPATISLLALLPLTLSRRHCISRSQHRLQQPHPSQ
ncbi:MAG TPA: hypothetical protein VH107_04100 [Lacipirellulaceae bacterium]|jgi:hypothetical protein|nr:hypothetical protein [Lacipirellulaceae bacterium]